MVVKAGSIAYNRLQITMVKQVLKQEWKSEELVDSKSGKSTEKDLRSQTGLRTLIDCEDKAKIWFIKMRDSYLNI